MESPLFSISLSHVCLIHVTSLCPGLDLPEFARDFMEFGGPGEVARRAVMIRAFLKPMQESFSAVEKVCCGEKDPLSVLNHARMEVFLLSLPCSVPSQ